MLLPTSALPWDSHTHLVRGGSLMLLPISGAALLWDSHTHLVRGGSLMLLPTTPPHSPGIRHIPFTYRNIT
jgi:hypothetical protein